MIRRLMFALGMALLAAPVAMAQAKPGDPKEETAETSDGVKIRCRFYAAQAGVGNGSCVILMHDYNADPDKGDWDGLARFLATECGVNVMRFDWRGHGQSKEIVADKFWKEPWNEQKVQGARKKPVKTSIDVKDFDPKYYPMLVNDLAAVRNVLDLKNDGRAVNTRTVYLIASGSAAPLAYLFLATEWSRPQIKPNPMGLSGHVNDLITSNMRRQNGTDVAGKDYAGLVLLSPSSTFTYERGTQKASSTIQSQTIKNLVSQYAKDTQVGGDLRGSSSLLVFVGDKDTEGEKQAKFYFDDLMAAGGKNAPKLEPMKNSKLIELKGVKEKGVDLLGKNNALRTEDTIKAFLEKMEFDRKKLNPVDRKYDKPFRINLQSFGIQQ